MNGSTPNNLTGEAKDASKHKWESLTLQFVPGETPTLIWHLQPKGDLIVLPTLPGQTMPADIILSKE